MKKIILFVFILGLFNSLLAQDTTKIKTKKFFVGVNFSPDMCYRTLHGSANYINPLYTGNELVHYRDSAETPKFGFTAGINVCYNITKHISIELGLQFSNKGYEDKERVFSYGPPPRQGSTYIPYNLPTQGRFLYSFNYIDVPLKANFAFGKRKTQFITSMGLTTNILISSSNILKGKTAEGKPYTSSSNSTGNYDRLNLSPTISVGIQHNINPRAFFRVEPIFRFGVINTYNNGAIAQYLWNTGINCGFYF